MNASREATLLAQLHLLDSLMRHSPEVWFAPWPRPLRGGSASSNTLPRGSARTNSPVLRRLLTNQLACVYGAVLTRRNPRRPLRMSGEPWERNAARASRAE